MENEQKNEFPFELEPEIHITNNIEKLTDEEYESIIEDYKFTNNIKLNKRLRWLEKYIDKSTKKKYVEKKKVSKIIQKICKDLEIESLSFNNFPF